MIEKDFHGYTVEAALLVLDNMIYHLSEIEEDKRAKLITGHGKIKKAFIKYASGWGCDIKEEMGNSGVLIMEVIKNE